MRLRRRLLESVKAHGERVFLTLEQAEGTGIMGKQAKDDTELYRRHVVANDELGRWDVYEGGCFLGSFDSESEAELYAASLQMLEALKVITKAARSWHDFHHGSKLISCDEICAALPAAEAAIQKAEEL
jgi:hypothetical protein